MRFFHTTAIKHKAINKISSVASNAKKLKKEDDIRKEMLLFFPSLLSKEENLYLQCQNEILFSILNLIYQSKNDRIKAIPNEKETKDVMFSFKGDKSLGLDGFPLFFFHQLW